MNRAAVVRELAAVLGRTAVLDAPVDCLVYETDGVSMTKNPPDVVVVPESSEGVQASVIIAARHGMPFVARGAGTGLSGGCLPVEGGLVISLARLDRIIEIHEADGYAVVEPGVVNLQLTERLKPLGFYFAPDPSSQTASTIGGNIAENAGGPHCLKYGATTIHVLGLEVVLPDGRLVRLGGPDADLPGYDLRGLFVGSEGTFGIATKAWVRILRLPETVETMLAVFRTVAEASNAVARVVAAGLSPAALEMIDKITMEAVEPFVQVGYPVDAGAVLLIEADGPADGMEDQVALIRDLCRECGAIDWKRAANEAERAKLWAGRKGAFGAFGRISPAFYVMDGVVPRSRIPEALAKVEAVSRKYGFRIANVFHAGDGNLHPNILFDPRDGPDVEARVMDAAHEILQACIDLGGTLSGEHGIGIEKREQMPMMFTEDDLAVMQRIRAVFNPSGLCNPSKIFPMRRACGEAPKMQSFPGAWI